MDDVARRLNRELADAGPVCDCEICSSPWFVFCPEGWRTLFGRLQWVMSELDAADGRDE